MKYKSSYTCKAVASADSLTIGYVNGIPSVWNGDMHVLQSGEEYREPVSEFADYSLIDSKWVKKQKKQSAKKANKRANGEGTAIKKRKDGLWRVAVTIGGERLYFYGKTQEETKAKRDEALDQARKGIYIKNTKLTFEEWIKTWLSEYAKPAIRPTTYDSYEYLCRVHIIPGLGKITLKELQPSQIQKFYNQKLKENLMDRRSETTKEKHEEMVKQGLAKKKEFKTISPATIRRMHIIISESLEQALKEGKIIRNPAKATKPPKLEKKEARYLTPEQLKDFLGKISDDYWYSAFVVALNSGVRLGELVALKWSNIDIPKGIIYIKEAVSWVKKEASWELYFHPPKSQKGLRSIPIPPMAIEELKRIKKRQAEEKLRLGEAYQGNGDKQDQWFVFTWQDGRLVDPFYLSKHFSKLMKKHGMSMNFHGLRHSYATALLQAGEHPKVVQELLGDSTISVVLDTYSHVTPGLKERAASKLEGLFDKKTSLTNTNV